MKIKFTFILLLIFLFSNILFAQGVPHISQSLFKEASRIKTDSRTKSASDEKIDVLFYPEDNNSDKIDTFFFKSRAIEYIKSRNFLSAKIPVNVIEQLDQIKGVKYIGLNKKAKALEIVSEGRDAVNASVYTYNNIDGSGIKIAIIDIGFKGYEDLQSIGELPKNLITKNFSSPGEPPVYSNYETEPHGTACAEIIYDFVPGSQIYLLKMYDVPSFQLAFDYCRSQGIKIVSASIGFSYDFWCDGTGGIAAIATEAYDNGILPIFAAGNEAEKSWFGKFNGNSENFMIFPNGRDYLELSVDAGKYVRMMWDDFAAKDKKYTLYMYNNTGTTLLDSSKWNNGDEPSVNVYNNTGNSRKVRVKIKKENVQEDLYIRLYFDGKYINASDKRSESSLSSPADSREVLSVGAVGINNWSNGPIESYSSWGPTMASSNLPPAQKPDIVAPTRVTTYTYGTRGFDGTSAATPHIAASAALLLSLDRTLSAGQLKEKVLSYYRQIASSPDNIYGRGKLVLDMVDIPSGNTDAVGNIVCYPNPVSISKNGRINITNLPYNTSLINLNVYTVTGEFVKSFNVEDLKSKNGRMTIEWNLKNQSGMQIAPGIYFLTIDIPSAKKKVQKIAIQK
ncbi:MAG: S8 family serine peptidase [Endomicrobium sp.]|jgi:subtilisin family serine protease|nr:S8 family serine peptidase [Endomicrobium sp.]